MNENLNLFLKWLIRSNKYSQITFNNYKSYLKKYQDDLEDINLIKEKLSLIQNQNTKRSHLHALILYFKWLDNKTFIKELLFLKISKKKIKKEKTFNTYTIKKERTYSLEIKLNEKEYRFLVKESKDWDVSKVDFIKLLINREERKEASHLDFKIF